MKAFARFVSWERSPLKVSIPPTKTLYFGTKIPGGYVSCSAACDYNIEWGDSVGEWEKLFEKSVEEHGAGCGAALGFMAPPPGVAIMAMCQTCDYCHTLVGH